MNLNSSSKRGFDMFLPKEVSKTVKE